MHKQSKNSNVVKETETIWTFMSHMFEQFLGTAVETRGPPRSHLGPSTPGTTAPNPAQADEH